MKKLLKLLSGYDNYLDEGAISELIDRLSNYDVINTIVYEINLVNEINNSCEDICFIKCYNKYGKVDSRTVCDIYLSLIFTKNLIYKDGVYRPSLSEDSVEVMITVLQESDYTTACEFDLDKIIIVEKWLAEYIKKKLDILSNRNLNIIGLHNMYNKDIEFDPFKDAVFMGYDNGRFLLIEFIPDKKA